MSEVIEPGIDFYTLENDSFPQLKMENTLLVIRLFDDLKKSLDVKTKLLTFENFIELMSQFKAQDVGQRIDRLFRVIDEDGNGMLSY